MNRTTKIAFVGTGFVADLYMRSLQSHPELELRGVFDRDQQRQQDFCRFHKVDAYPSLDGLLSDPEVELVVNLTNPASHYDVTHAALEAGKHVYTEKPLAMSPVDAAILVDKAEKSGLLISGAPCSLLSESAQNLWRALESNQYGQPRLVYAELDDGMIHQAPYSSWVSASGAPWPAKDEFEVGCTIEHAAYYLTWLCAFFGPVQHVTAHGETLIPAKRDDLDPDLTSPDFTVSILRFSSGVIARLTCSIVASHDHRLRIFTDVGVISTKDCWDNQGRIVFRKRVQFRRRQFEHPVGKRLRFIEPSMNQQKRYGAARMDFCLGLRDQAMAIRERREPILSARFLEHVNELSIAIGQSMDVGHCFVPKTSFKPLSPLPGMSRCAT